MIDVGPVGPPALPESSPSAAQCWCGEPGVPTSADWWLCEAGHDFRPAAQHAVRTHDWIATKTVRG